MTMENNIRFYKKPDKETQDAKKWTKNGYEKAG